MNPCPVCRAALPEGARKCPTCGASLSPSAAPATDEARQTGIDVAELQADLAASLAPEYEIVKSLGVGGMGAVFLAREPALWRLVAVKVLAPRLAADPEARARFAREARAAASLSHPNVIPVHAVGRTRELGLPYIVMQYVQGTSLTEWAKSHGRPSEREARRIVGEVAAGLAAAHERGIIHRDVKPGNVLLEDLSGRAYVADFGVSAALEREGTDDGRLTEAGMVVGTPVYMSPEQASGEAVTPRSDVYGLGVLAYELFAGELPFHANTALGWAAAHLRDTPTPLAGKRSGLAPDVARLVDRCLAKDPRNRPTAAEVARGMLPSLATDLEWPPPGLASLHRRATVFERAVLIAALAGLVLVATLGFTPDVLLVHRSWLGAFALAAVPGPQSPPSYDALTDIATSYFVWQALLVLATTAFLVGTAYAVAQLWVLIPTAIRERRAGWRWNTLFDVAADPDGRSGAMLAGDREFASLDASRRKRGLILRRLRWIGVPSGSIVTLFLVIGWDAAMLSGGGAASPSPLVGPGLALTAIVPLGLGALVSFGAALAERRLTGPLIHRAPYVPSPGEISAWYAGVPDAGPAALRAVTPRHAGRVVGRMSVVGTAVVAVVLVAALGAGALQALVASVLAARFAQRNGPAAAELLDHLHAHQRDTTLAAAERLLAPLEPTPTPLDSATARTLLRALFQPQGNASVPGFSDIQRGAIRALIGNRAAVFRQADRHALSPDTVALLADLARHPRIGAFRRLARARSLDIATAPLDQPLESYDLTSVPTPSTTQLSAVARAVLVTAALPLQRGRPREAAARIGEVAAFTGHLLRTPDFLSNQAGVGLLEHDVLPALADLDDAMGRRREAHDARLLAAHLTSVPLYFSGAAALAADPGSLGPFRRALLHDSLPPGQRLRLLKAAWTGVCGNPWEILRGPSRQRRQELLALADSARVGAYGRSITRLEGRLWETGEPFPRPLARLIRFAMCSAS